MNYIITLLIAGLTFLGGQFITKKQVDTAYNAGGSESQTFGATNFPTSLDSLTNPSATDSVATVSHSAQHSNANDAIEALQAKLGTGASTAVANSIFAGNGSGTSLFTTSPTSTTYTTTGLGTFGSLISQASSTIVGGLTITGNSTTTNATTTIGAFTNYATSTKYYGAGLTNCSAGNFITWTDGSYGCGSPNALINVSAGVSSSSLNSYIYGGSVNMTANDVLILSATCYNNTPREVYLRVRPSFNSSSTTIAFAPNVSLQNNYAQGAFTATTTATVYFDASSSDNCGGISNSPYGIGINYIFIGQ